MDSRSSRASQSGWVAEVADAVAVVGAGTSVGTEVDDVRAARGAFTGVARLGTGGRRVSAGTSESDRSRKRARTCLSTGAAGDGAATPDRPGAEFTINWTVKDVAVVAFSQVRAFSATEVGSGSHSAAASVATTSARKGTRAVQSPFADNAVDWAVELVAILLLNKIWASLTAVGSLHVDVTSATLHAATT